MNRSPAVAVRVAISHLPETHRLSAPWALPLLLCLVLSACQTTNPYTGEKQVSKTTIGGGIGAAGGAVVGAIAGGRKAAA